MTFHDEEVPDDVAMERNPYADRVPGPEGGPYEALTCDQFYLPLARAGWVSLDSELKDAVQRSEDWMAAEEIEPR